MGESKGTAQQILFTVYYGDAITESDGGLEAVYESLMALGEAMEMPWKTLLTSRKL